MATATHIPNAPAGDEFLLRLPRDGFKYERVGGRIQMSAAAFGMVSSSCVWPGA
jgi:hypothetical protein